MLSTFSRSFSIFHAFLCYIFSSGFSQNQNPISNPKFLFWFSSLTNNVKAMSRKGGASLQKDVPWKASAGKSIPKIHQSPLLRLAQTPYTNYAIAVMKHPDPIGSGLAIEAIVESAGPECIVPGRITPIRLLGVKVFRPFGEKVWPIEVNMKFLEPVVKELKLLGKLSKEEAEGNEELQHLDQQSDCK